MVQDQLRDGPLAQGAAGPQRAAPALRLQQLTGHDRHQFTLHRAGEHAGAAAAARPAAWGTDGELVRGDGGSED